MATRTASLGTVLGRPVSQTCRHSPTIFPSRRPIRPFSLFPVRQQLFPTSTPSRPHDRLIHPFRHLQPYSTTTQQTPTTDSNADLVILPRALARLRQLAIPTSTSSSSGSATTLDSVPVRLRIAVFPGGCHGFQYEFKLEEVIDPGPDLFSHPAHVLASAVDSQPVQDDLDDLDDDADDADDADDGTVETNDVDNNLDNNLDNSILNLSSAPAAFAGSLFPPDQDVFIGKSQQSETPVVVDRPSLAVIKGASLDYTDDLIGSQFVLTNIPGSKSSCGCGTSFDVNL